jgi:hypothetical protein
VEDQAPASPLSKPSAKSRSKISRLNVAPRGMGAMSWLKIAQRSVVEL